MMWRAYRQLFRSFSSSTNPLKEQSSRLTKLAARKPPSAILETDLEETFIKGSGPGGQKINKTSNCVQLRHIPTGLSVKCQETRSREENRRIARRILHMKLDVLENGEHSLAEIKKWSEMRKKKSREKKSRRKYRRLKEETFRSEQEV